MAGLLRQLGERLEECPLRAVPRIAPQPAVVLFLLLIRRHEQRAVPLPRERLPVEILRARLRALARADAAAVLMHEDAADRFHALGNPHAVCDTEDKVAFLLRRRIAHLMIAAIRESGQR